MLNLIVATSPVNFAGEFELLEQMYEKCPFSLHVRKPGFSERALERFLLSLNEEIRAGAVLHGAYEEIADLAFAFNTAGACVDFLHAKQTKGAFKNCFVACKSIEELRSLPYFAKGILYPVYDSLSEIGVKGRFMGQSVKEFEKTSVFAFGGVSEENMGELLTLGYAGALVCGSVWNYADPVCAWMRLFRKNMVHFI